MLRRFILYLLIMAFSGCIEPYQFVIQDESPVLVVEGFISDVSYKDAIQYPSDGRYFSVKLSYTSDVTNRRGEPITDASVSLVSDGGDVWFYTSMDPGEYLLLDQEFSAESGKKYKLNIELSNGEFYESEWQMLPEDDQKPIGQVSFEETDRLTYKYVAGEKVVRTVQGINVYIDLPVNSGDNSILYRWDFEPIWIFEAPLFPAVNRVCWVASHTYLNDYVLQEDFVGGYKKQLFFIETENNERLLWDFSLLIRQFTIDTAYHQFLTDIKTQTSSGLNDALPYNLETNISGGENNTVDGYFAVVREKATRWYFNQSQLSYPLENNIKKFCEDPLSDKGPLCWDCLAYGNGIASTHKPAWWRK